MDRYTMGLPVGYNNDREMQCDDDGEYVLYSEAQARIEALEWLVEVMDVEFFELRCAAQRELGETYKAARAAARGAGDAK